MKISQFLNKESIIKNLGSRDKKNVIEELAAMISKICKIPAQKITAILMEREALGSTGIGGAIAIPHGKLDLMESIVIGFGLSKEGVEYDSLDNKPVHIFFLLLTSNNSTDEHLRVLAQISKLLKMDDFKKKLLATESVDDIHNIIKTMDEEF